MQCLSCQVEYRQFFVVPRRLSQTRPKLKPVLLELTFWGVETVEGFGLLRNEHGIGRFLLWAELDPI